MCRRDTKKALDFLSRINSSGTMLNRESYTIYVYEKHCPDSLFKLFQKYKEEYLKSIKTNTFLHVPQTYT